MDEALTAPLDTPVIFFHREESIDESTTYGRRNDLRFV
jgi:hypothetical protein